MRDKEDYNKLLKKKVADALKMNDYENYFRARLDKTYTDIKDICEMHAEADKVRNNSTTFFKFGYTNGKVNNQSVSLEDFGISEDAIE